MNSPERAGVSQRSDAQRNRERILAAARAMFADGQHAAAAAPGTGEQSMAEVARRAGVGRATLYRNFPTRRDLLEALFADDIDTVVAAAAAPADDPASALVNWLRSFAEFESSKHAIVTELLQHTTIGDPVLQGSRHRVLEAGRRLLDAAQQTGAIRADVTLDDALDLVLAVVSLTRPRDHTERLLTVALDGLHTRARDSGTSSAPGKTSPPESRR